MKYNFTLILVLSALVSCQENTKNANHRNNPVTINDLIENLEDSNNKEVMVIAHRGDWRNAPENSIQAIENCIEMGVDMVEIDIRETKDGHLVLMHDETIDRTTKASGYVKDWTFDSLRTLKLLDGLGMETNHGIPTLEEALLVAKGKILINLDKSYEIFDKCYEVMVKTGTLNQVLIKGTKTIEEVESEFGQYLDKVYFMPVLFLPNPDAQEIVEEYIDKRLPVAFEFIIKNDSLQFIEKFKEIRESGSGVWVNSLWSQQNGGHDDEKAALDPSVYDWYIENNVDMIQTDRPELLLTYLRERGLHN